MKKTEKILFFFAVASVALLAVFVIGEAIMRDSTAPVITCPENTLKAKVNITEEQILENVHASDDKDGDLSDSVVVESLSSIGKNNTREITYAVMDQSGNVGRATRTLQYKDYHKPKIHIDQPLRVKGREGVMDALESIRASSKLDGDLSDKVKYSFSDGGYGIGEGEYDVILRVNDSAGGVTTIHTVLEIYNPQKENIEIELSRYIVYLRTGAKFDPYDYYEIASKSGRLIMDSDVDTTVPGTYHVTYTIQGDDGESYGKTRLIVVVGK